MPGGKYKKKIAEASRKKRTAIAKSRSESQKLYKYWHIEAGAMADNEDETVSKRNRKQGKLGIPPTLPIDDADESDRPTEGNAEVQDKDNNGDAEYVQEQEHIESETVEEHMDESEEDDDDDELESPNAQTAGTSMVSGRNTGKGRKRIASHEEIDSASKKRKAPKRLKRTGLQDAQCKGCADYACARRWWKKHFDIEPEEYCCKASLKNWID